MKLTMYDFDLTETSSSSSTISNNETDSFRSSARRNMLPVYYVKKDLLVQISKYDTFILLGETGCGKTTQIPQYILESRLNGSGMIVVSQPRRIAAVSIAHRVSEEMSVQCGDIVGYQIRFHNNTSSKTKLVYATDGRLLREAMSDPMLSKYSIIILDEAHERTVTTDILFGVVKHAQHMRKFGDGLKVIIMSAALDVDHFKEYFDDAPVFHIEGRRYNVDIFHTEEKIDDYYFTCLATVFNIHSEAPPNDDILVFLTGQEEIEKMTEDIRAICKSHEFTFQPIQVHALYASADPNNLLDIFIPAIEGTRKVIVSTNVAETSITIPGIKYVVDSGRIKVNFYNSLTGISVLKVLPVSQEQALQRAGRAGRERDGVCYRTYSTEQFENLKKSSIPEIKRSNLSTIMLTLLTMKLNPMTFKFIDKPDEQAIRDSLKELVELGALDNIEELKLTDVGEKMSCLPLDPRYSKIILNATNFGCLDDILSIIAMLSTDNIFITSANTDPQVHETRRRLFNSAGDHISLLKIFRWYNQSKCKTEWCKEYSISSRAMDFARNIKSQLQEQCSKFYLSVLSTNDESKIRQCLITGLYKNVAVLQPDKTYLTATSRQRCLIHPSSALHKSLPPCLIYTELVESCDLYMKTVSVIDTDWLNQYVPQFVTSKMFGLLNKDGLL